MGGDMCLGAKEFRQIFTRPAGWSMTLMNWCVEIGVANEHRPRRDARDMRRWESRTRANNVRLIARPTADSQRNCLQDRGMLMIAAPERRPGTEIWRKQGCCGRLFSGTRSAGFRQCGRADRGRSAAKLLVADRLVARLEITNGAQQSRAPTPPALSSSHLTAIGAELRGFSTSASILPEVRSSRETRSREGSLPAGSRCRVAGDQQPRHRQQTSRGDGEEPYGPVALRRTTATPHPLAP